MSISTAKAAVVLGLAAGLAFGAAGSASAFPKPKYSTTVQTGQAPQTTVAASQLPAAAANPANAATKAVASVASAAQPVAGAKSWSVYMVQKGDTLSGVGRRFGAPVKTLSDLNELDAKVPLKAGMKLKLPPGTADSGKDPYAAGPSPFSLSSGPPARSAAPSSSKAKSARPAKQVQAEPQPEQASPPVQRPAPVAVRPASSKPAAAEPTPARTTVAERPAVQDAPPPRVAAAPKPAMAEAPLIDQTAPADPAVAAGHGRFAWPVKGSILSRFGPLGPGERNDGLNIGADQGAEVRAAAGGEVVYAGSDVKGFGNVVLIKHPDGWVTAYAHLGGISVRIRDHVEQGQAIGTVGKSGGVDQPQLHFETRWSSTPREKHKPVDPLKLLP